MGAVTKWASVERRDKDGPRGEARGRTPQRLGIMGVEMSKRARSRMKKGAHGPQMVQVLSGCHCCAMSYPAAWV